MVCAIIIRFCNVKERFNMVLVKNNNKCSKKVHIYRYWNGSSESKGHALAKEGQIKIN